MKNGYPVNHPEPRIPNPESRFPTPETRSPRRFTMSFNFPERLSLAHLPTPVEKLEYPVKGAKIHLYIKRDDLTECVASGNKVRKLEFLFAEAKALAADTIITCGGVQSNHARATALFCAKLGFKSVLVLRGEEPQEIDGNLFLDKLLGAEIRYITRAQWASRGALMQETGEKLAAAGRVPYIIPEGASNALGSLGYILAVQEIKEQLDRKGISIDCIISATGSGGTQAGLIMGTKQYMPEVGVMSFNVCDNEEYFRKRIGEIIEDAHQKFGGHYSLKKEDITVIDGYAGRGYAVSSLEELELITDLARRTGIVLDPVYTGKAFYGLMKEIEKGRFPDGSTVLFLHTGGIFGLFPKKSQFTFQGA